MTTFPLKSFRQLQKMMGLTASLNDGEALNALRAANKVLDDHNLTWEQVFKRLVTIDLEEGLEDEMQPGASAQAEEIDEAFVILEKADLRDGFETFIASLQEQWSKKKWLSLAQREALFKAARSHAHGGTKASRR